LVLGLGLVLAACSQQEPAPLTEEEFLAKAQTVHAQALTMDTHVDIGRQYATAELDPGSEDNDLRCSLPNMEKGGLDGVFLAVYVGQRGGLDEEGYRSAYESAMVKFEAIHRLAETMHPDRCELATRTDDVERIAGTGKRVIMIGIENGYPVGEDLSLVKKYYDLGARYITLSHSGHNQICDSSGPSEPMHNGLSDFGKEVVAEMNRLGIIVDVSHISEKSYWDVIEATKSPIMASHSGCAALNDHNRNLNDDQLRALAKNGGVIQVVALGGFLKGQSPERIEAIAALREELGFRRVRGQQLQNMTEEQRAEYQKLRETYQERMESIDAQYPPAGVTVKDYVDHIDHAVKIAGIDHVGIGTDFDGGGGITGFNNHSECLNVTIELLRRGYSEEEIKKIWGGNLMRVWRQVESVASESTALD
jgi:microsomal dipeptidase-like Zn-dependent dipeptidase